MRAIVDSSSTMTLTSSGLLEKMLALKGQIKPTSLGFYGVREQSIIYSVMMYHLDL